MANSYEMDTLVRISGRFVGADGTTLTDPTAVSLYVKAGAGSITTFTLSGAQVIKDSTGLYHYDYNSGNSAVTISYKWQGTGAVVTTSSDGSFAVNSSIFSSVL